MVVKLVLLFKLMKDSCIVLRQSKTKEKNDINANVSWDFNANASYVRPGAGAVYSTGLL